jgi:hypothetical protein
MEVRAMNAIKIHDMLVNAMRHQVKNSSAAKAIKAGGFEHELSGLLVQIAANAANPIADAIADERIEQAIRDLGDVEPPAGWQERVLARIAEEERTP